MGAKWISVKDAMPDVDKTKSEREQIDVIVAVKFGNEIETGAMIYERAIVRGRTVYRWKNFRDRIVSDVEITHWMPMPQFDD